MKKPTTIIPIILFAVTIGCHSGKKLDAPHKDPVSPADTALFRTVQQQTFQYFWDGAEPVSGLARERFHADNIYPQKDKHIVTSGEQDLV